MPTVLLKDRRRDCLREVLLPEIMASKVCCAHRFASSGAAASKKTR
jgi:hypothetical protein